MGERKAEVSVHNQLALKQAGTAQEQLFVVAEDSKSSNSIRNSNLLSSLILYVGYTH